MVKVALVGLGKMGLSHLAVFRAHPDVDVVGVCDSSSMVLDVLAKYTGVATFTDLNTMLEVTYPDALVVATPSHLHASMVRSALARGIHVFCEKPFVLDLSEGSSLAAQAAAEGLVTQIGYHNRFVAAFAEMKRLIDSGAVGTITHVLAEAYGPVVLKPTGTSWRSKRSSGGGCLYDYAAHPVDLLTWYFGEVTAAQGTIFGRVFSAEAEDEVYGTLRFANGVTGQLSVSWSDPAERKMSTKITVWGTRGRLYADRQEVRAYLTDKATPPEGYQQGWNVRYTTELTEQVWYYLRGEEYSAQVDAFIQRVAARQVGGLNDIESGIRTDRALALIVANAEAEDVGSRALPAHTQQMRTSSTGRAPRRRAVQTASVSAAILVRKARQAKAARRKARTPV